MRTARVARSSEQRRAAALSDGRWSRCRLRCLGPAGCGLGRAGIRSLRHDARDAVWNDIERLLLSVANCVAIPCYMAYSVGMFLICQALVFPRSRSSSRAKRCWSMCSE